MRPLIAASVAFAALAMSQASAADMALKAPPAPAVFSWAGFYGGANVGYSWGNSSNNWNTSAANIGGATACPPAAHTVCLTGADLDRLNGVLGGIQLGYNWQTGRYVFGIETDFDGAGQRGSQTFNAVNAGAPPVAPAPMVAAYSEKLLWLGTLRGRVGIAADRTFLYATGGLAYGEVKNTGTATIAGLNVPGPAGPPCTVTPPAVGTCPLANWSNTAVRAGWTLGGGIEQALPGNWSVRLEYLFVDLGRVNTTFATLPGCFGGSGAACSPVVAGTGTISSRITDSVLRAGLNYKFGG